MSCHVILSGISEFNHLPRWISSTHLPRLVFYLHLCDHWYVHLRSLAEQLWDVCLGSHRVVKPLDRKLRPEVRIWCTSVIHKCIYLLSTKMCCSHLSHTLWKQRQSQSIWCLILLPSMIHSHQPPFAIPITSRHKILQPRKTRLKETHHKIQSRKGFFQREKSFVSTSLKTNIADLCLTSLLGWWGILPSKPSKTTKLPNLQKTALL